VIEISVSFRLLDPEEIFGLEVGRNGTGTDGIRVPAQRLSPTGTVLILTDCGRVRNLKAAVVKHNLL